MIFIWPTQTVHHHLPADCNLSIYGPLKFESRILSKIEFRFVFSGFSHCFCCRRKRSIYLASGTKSDYHINRREWKNWKKWWIHCGGCFEIFNRAGIKNEHNGVNGIICEYVVEKWGTKQEKYIQVWMPFIFLLRGRYLETCGTLVAAVTIHHHSAALKMLLWLKLLCLKRHFCLAIGLKYYASFPSPSSFIDGQRNCKKHGHCH